MTVDFAPPRDPIAAVTHPDPYPYYRTLAATPFHRHGALGLWIAASPAQVAEVLEHPDCRVRPLAQPVPPALAGTSAGTLFGRLVRMNEGAAHAPLKGVLQRELARIDAGAAARRAQAIAADLPFGKEEVDRWLFTLPALALADAIGLRMDGDAEGIAHSVASFAAAISPLATPAVVEAGALAAQRLMSWAEEAGTDLHALHEAAAEAGVEPAALSANLAGLLVQSCEATTALAGSTLLRLAREPSLPIAEAVSRTAREDPPVQNTRRFLGVDATLCGVPVKSGDVVLVVLAAASCAATDAERPWTFGAGRHACPGEVLAAALAGATVDALLSRGADPRALARQYRYRPSVNVRIPQFS